MFGVCKRLMLAAALAAGFGPIGAASARAQGVELDLSGRNPQLRLVNPQDEELRRERRRDEGGFRRRDRAEEARRCSADDALDKAERLGVRRARVSSIGRRFIEVSGRRYGAPVEITFARDPRCSIVG